ncbi:MAG: plastocyanin/azurin family copper-binding protein [Chloroflexota bacterium]|nr:plastocyanin/azurin family copper-binding protein [Chloroflexota bacterium]
MRFRAIVLSAAVLISCSGRAAPTDAEAGRAITISIGDFFFSPALAEVRAGERITFVLKNFGIYEHEFMAGRDAVSGKGYANDWLAAAGADGSSGHEMGHTGVGIRVAPNETATVTMVVPVDAGEFEFGCFIAGHYESGMKGKLVVVSNGDPSAPSTGAPSKSGGPAPSATPHPMGSMGDDDGEGH